MQLLDKRQVNQAQAGDRKLEIEQGISLAKKVDDLRHTYALEEKKLRDFKETNVSATMAEIKLLTDKVELLEVDIAEAERILAEKRKPLDAEWNKLKSEQIKHENVKRETLAASERAEKLKNVYTQKYNEYGILERESKKLIVQTRLNHEASEEKLKDALVIKREAESYAKEIKQKFADIKRGLINRENTIASKERDLKNKEKSLKKLERQITLNQRRYQ